MTSKELNECGYFKGVILPGRFLMLNPLHFRESNITIYCDGCHYYEISNGWVRYNSFDYSDLYIVTDVKDNEIYCDIYDEE